MRSALQGAVTCVLAVLLISVAFVVAGCAAARTAPAGAAGSPLVIVHPTPDPHP